MFVIAASMSASVGCGVRRSNAAAAMTCPDWQYPHCGTSSATHAFWTRCVDVALRPSMVVIGLVPTAETGSTHERTASPPRCTVHAPHCAMPHPNFVPVIPRLSRRTHRSGVFAAASTVRRRPFTRRVYEGIGQSLRRRGKEKRGGQTEKALVRCFMTTYARRLGLFSGTMAVVGGIIGGGIFRTPATVAERLRSPGLVLLAWVIGGVVALIGAFCWGELGQRRPRAGGGYVYLRETFGPLPAFLYGWTLVLVIATGAIAAVAVTFADYTLALLGFPHTYSVPLAVAANVFLAGINYVGVRPAAITQNIFTILKLVALAILIAVGVFAVAPTVPYRPVPSLLPSEQSALPLFRFSLHMAAGSRRTSSPRKSSSPKEISLAR